MFTIFKSTSLRILFETSKGNIETTATRNRKKRKNSGGRWSPVRPNLIVGYVVPQKSVVSDIARIAFYLFVTFTLFTKRK